MEKNKNVNPIMQHRYEFDEVEKKCLSRIADEAKQNNSSIYPEETTISLSLNDLSGMGDKNKEVLNALESLCTKRIDINSIGSHKPIKVSNLKVCDKEK